MKEKESILHLICGLPGSGKTTLARRIESESGAIRLTPDEWIKAIWPTDIAATEGNNYRNQIEKLQWKIGKKILKAGIDVIIEWGTWLRDERCELRDEAWAIGSKVKFYYMKTDKKILQERIIERNKNLSEYDFHIPEDTLSEDLEKYEKQFQIPQKSELETYDYLG